MPQVDTILTTLAVVIPIALKFGLVVGAAGSLLEGLGVWRNWPKLVMVGQKLEALGADIPKLVGKIPQANDPKPPSPPPAPTSLRPNPSDPSPPEPPHAAIIGLTVLGTCLAALVSCGGSSKPPCDQAKLAAIVAVCTAQSQACKSAGTSEAECSTLVDCDAQIDRACSAGAQ